MRILEDIRDIHKNINFRLTFDAINHVADASAPPGGNGWSLAMAMPMTALMRSIRSISLLFPTPPNPTSSRRSAGQVPHDEGFEALFTGVCFHCAPSPAAFAIKYPSSKS